MRTKVIILLLVMCIITPITVFARDMIYTNWHNLDGPYWIFKPKAISISSSYIYAFGGDKDTQYKIVPDSCSQLSGKNDTIKNRQMWISAEYEVTPRF
ncbi:MAG: hypothetical protein GX409_00355 [candidate division Zixibacteria bacterium]|nr:hypothetical protein [candidate division Zixibacteria bacterium]